MPLRIGPAARQPLLPAAGMICGEVSSIPPNVVARCALGRSDLGIPTMRLRRPSTGSINPSTRLRARWLRIEPVRLGLAAAQLGNTAAGGPWKGHAALREEGWADRANFAG